LKSGRVWNVKHRVQTQVSTGKETFRRETVGRQETIGGESETFGGTVSQATSEVAVFSSKELVGAIPGRKSKRHKVTGFRMWKAGRRGRRVSSEKGGKRKQ